MKDIFQLENRIASVKVRLNATNSTFDNLAAAENHYTTAQQLTQVRHRIEKLRKELNILQAAHAAIIAGGNIEAILKATTEIL